MGLDLVLVITQEKGMKAKNKQKKEQLS